MPTDYKGCTAYAQSADDSVFLQCSEEGCGWDKYMGLAPSMQDLVAAQHEHQKEAHPIEEPVQRMPEDASSADIIIFDRLPAGLRLAEDAYVEANDTAAVWVEAAGHRIFIGVVRKVWPATNGAGIFYRLSIMQDLIKFDKATINSGPQEG